MYLTDLAFIEEGTPNYTEDGLVNFSKMRMVRFPQQGRVGVIKTQAQALGPLKLCPLSPACSIGTPESNFSYKNHGSY